MQRLIQVIAVLLFNRQDIISIAEEANDTERILFQQLYLRLLFQVCLFGAK